MIYLAYAGAFLEIAIAALSFSLFPFLTTEAMALDPNTPSCLLFCKSQSGSKGGGGRWPERRQGSALAQATK